MKKSIYLDYAAATPLDKHVLSEMMPCLSDHFYNPSATYLAATKVKKAIETARSSVAQNLGVRAPEIVFTNGGTEANNLAIRGVMQQYPDSNVVVSAVEHDSVLVPAERFQCRKVGVSREGRINLDKLSQAIDDKTVLISVMYANNEIGTIQPIKKITEIIETVRAERLKHKNPLPLIFHTDACQAGNYLSLLVNKLGIDMMTLNGGKIYGPKGSGALYVRTGIKLLPIIDGGGQERGLRSGTENVAGIVGFAKALEIAVEMRDRETERLRALQNDFRSRLGSIPGAVLNGGKKTLPNNVHVTLSGRDNERLMMALDEMGIQCAVGSACSASSEEPSHVLSAIGMSDEEARGSLRFTMGRGTTAEDITKAHTALLHLLG